MLELIKPNLEFLCGSSPQKKDLLALARDVCRSTVLEIDRLSKRNGACLLCWFCENWGTIEQQIQSLPNNQPRAYDTRPLIGRVSGYPEPTPPPDPEPTPSVDSEWPDFPDWDGILSLDDERFVSDDPEY
jgi:hypothetical protein